MESNENYSLISDWLVANNIPLNTVTYRTIALYCDATGCSIEIASRDLAMIDIHFVKYCKTLYKSYKTWLTAVYEKDTPSLLRNYCNSFSWTGEETTETKIHAYLIKLSSAFVYDN